MSAPATPADFEALREMEVKWLSETLAASIANIGYPVGCGMAPNEKHLENAAGKLFDRYLTMFRMVHETAGTRAALQDEG